MALNLWKIGGKPTSYNPLPTGTSNKVNVLSGDYKVRITAKSVSSGAFRLALDNSSQLKRLDTGVTGVIVFNLTSVSNVYEATINVSQAQYIYIVDHNNTGDIIIDSIELVQKPLPKLTLNGVDGFTSGKWSSITSQSTVIDDETLIFNSPLTFQETRLLVNVVRGQTYTFKTENSDSNGRYYITDSGSTIIANAVTVGSTLTFTPQVDTIQIRFGNYSVINTPIIFKRPMLNLGSTPAPYSRKTGDKMMLPVAKKNLFNKDGNFVNRNAVVFNNGSVWNTGGVNAARLMTDYLIPLKPNTTYTISKIPSNYAVAIHQINASGSPIIDSGWFSNDFTFTTSSSTYLADLYFRNNPDGGTVNPSVASGFLLQLEEGTSATAYEPYAVQGNKKPKKTTVKARTGLVFNGTSDYFQLPSMTMDSVEIECLIDSVQTISSAVLFHGGGKLIRIDGVFSGIDAIFVNGITQSGAIVRGNRSKIKVNFTDTPRINSIFSTTSALSFLKGTLYKVTCYLGNQIVAQYDFENPSNIVGTSVLQKAVNLIPSFEDARWSFQPTSNAKVLGKDVLHLDTIGSDQQSFVFIDVLPSVRYLFNANLVGSGYWQVCYFDANNTQVSCGNLTNATSILIASNIVKVRIATRNTGASSFDFVKPQLYALSGNEGTLFGSPIQSNKRNKRILYNKR